MKKLATEVFVIDSVDVIIEALVVDVVSKDFSVDVFNGAFVTEVVNKMISALLVGFVAKVEVVNVDKIVANDLVVDRFDKMNLDSETFVAVVFNNFRLVFGSFVDIRFLELNIF
jgi:hypothetical protein